MRRCAPLVFLVLFLFVSTGGKAQQKPLIQKPVLELEGTTLVISYVISNSSGSDEFVIGIEVMDGEGKVLFPATVSGDLGEKISGGKQKEIRWDLEADQVPLDLVLHIAVVGSRVIQETAPAELASISRWGAVGRSALFPGWGLSVVHPGQLH